MQLTRKWLKIGVKSFFAALFIITFISNYSASLAQFAGGGSSGGGRTCTGDPNIYECLPSGFCDLYPDHLRCFDIRWCESYPDDPDCITPEFCELQPEHDRCIPDEPEECLDYAGAPVTCDPDEDPSNDPKECRDAFGKLVECPDDRSDFCRKNPDSPECIAPEFCELYPKHIRCTEPNYCEKNPDDPDCITPEFCRLHPNHEKCVPGEPEECFDAAGAPVQCDPEDEPKECLDPFGNVVECPEKEPEKQYCPDGTPVDDLKRCPEEEDNRFPGDDERHCIDEIPGKPGVLALVPCGDPDDDICAHPEHKNDPDCCEKWDPTGQRCLDHEDDEEETEGYCVEGIPGTPNFQGLKLCEDQKINDYECESKIDGVTVLVPCKEQENDYEQCVEDYDEAMCDGDPYNDYLDLPEDEEQKEAILKLAEYCPDYMKIFRGYLNPDGSMTHIGGWADPIIRYDAVLVLQRFEECKNLTPYKGKFPFNDVSSDHYAYDAVGESFAEGKTQGYTVNGVQQFQGANKVLTTEALKWIMLVQTTEAAVDAVVDNGILNPATFAQVEWAAKWWLAAINWQIANPPIVNGQYDIQPVSPATRGDIAVWLANALGL